MNNSDLLHTTLKDRLKHHILQSVFFSVKRQIKITSAFCILKDSEFRDLQRLVLSGIVLIDNFVPFSLVLKYNKYMGRFCHGK